MIASADLLAFLRGWEGVRGGPALVAYQDSGGTWTIGYGHTLFVYQGQQCGQAQAEQWLQDDAAHAMRAVCALVTHTMQQNEADACCAFTFNVGAANFASSSIVENMNHGRFDLAAGVFIEWDNVRVAGVLTPSAGVLKRRMAERAIFVDGDYSGRP